MNQEKVFNFTLTEQEAETIIQGLGELPAKISLNIITKMQNQYRDQCIPNSVHPVPELVNTNITETTNTEDKVEEY